jgi:hypothetical protein
VLFTYFVDTTQNVALPFYVKPLIRFDKVKFVKPCDADAWQHETTLVVGVMCVRSLLDCSLALPALFLFVVYSVFTRLML